MHKELNKESFYYGFPVALVTTKNFETGIDNITPISSTWTLGKTVVLGIGIYNEGYSNISLGSTIILNIADENIWEKVEKISFTTGSKVIPDFKKEMGYEYCADKFALGGLTRQENKTGIPSIKECPIQIIVKVTNISEKDFFAIVECEIDTILVEENILKNDKYIDVNKWNPLIYKFREYTSASKHLGKNFRFEEYLN